MGIPRRDAATQTGDRAAAVAETHGAIVFFVGDRAYKIKKPVRFPFLDFSTLALREAVLRRELTLNRRLAPDVYLQVLCLRDEKGNPVEAVLEMRRMPSKRRLSRLVTSPHTDQEELPRLLREIAQTIVPFHKNAAVSEEIRQSGTPRAIREKWNNDLEEIQAFVPNIIASDMLRRVEELATQFFLRNEELFTRRQQEGWVRDGHGDLLADDIFCLEDGPRILDCIEFDDKLRWGDVLSDIAFLAMDLEYLQRPDLATLFVDTYNQEIAAVPPKNLFHHYVAHRALIRAKVACHRAEQGHENATAQAQLLMGLCEKHREQARVRLLLLGGLPGTGKTTLAKMLCQTLDWPALHSDALRAGLQQGHGPIDPDTAKSPTALGKDTYSPARKQAIYHKMREEAAQLLDTGTSVILDASWTDSAEREAVRRLAHEKKAEIQEICCVLPDAQAAERIRAREKQGGDFSEATVEVATHMATHASPWHSAQSLDTSGPRTETMRRALTLLGLPCDTHQTPKKA